MTPSVISLLADDDNDVLISCTPNYNALYDLIYISRSDTADVVQGNSTTISVVDRRGLEGVVFTCLIADPASTTPTPSLDDPDTFIAQDSSTLRNINGT